MRYFFNIAGAVFDPDNDGHELESHAEARLMAVKSAAELLRDEPHLVWLGEEFRVEVTDEEQEILFTIVVLGVDSPATAAEAASTD